MNKKKNNSTIEFLIEGLSIERLKEVRDYIDSELIKRDNSSWNERVLIKEVCTDFNLTSHLQNMGITNMAEFKRNGLRNIPESLIEISEWTLKFFDFTELEKKARVKSKANKNLTK